jgi:hypothetical protein
VHDAGENDPAAELAHVTEPPGETGPSGPASETTAVHVVVCPVTSESGAQDADVALDRSATGIEAEAELPRCVASPA